MLLIFAVFVFTKEGFLFISQHAIYYDLQLSQSFLLFKDLLLCMLHVSKLLCLCRGVIGSGRLPTGETLWLGATSRRSYHLCVYIVLELAVT